MCGIFTYMRAWGGILASVLVSFGAAGCDAEDAGPPPEVQLGDVADAVGGGKQDGVAMEVELGDSLEYDVVPRPAGVEAGPEHVAAMLFHVDAGQTFAVVMRGADGSDFDPYLMLASPDGHELVSDYHQAVVPDAAEDDAVVVWHALQAGQYIAVAGDLDLAVTATFQLDFIPLDAPAPDVDLTITDAGMRAWTDEVRRIESMIISRDAVHEDGRGNLVADDGTPLIDRSKINGANRVREDYFEALAETHEVSVDHLRAVLGPLWAALETEAYARR